MSLFAGMIRTDGSSVGLDRAVVQEIRDNLSRADDPVRTFSTPGFFLAYVDIGVFGTPAWVEETETGVTVATGHPYFGRSGGSKSRREHVGAIRAALAAGPAEPVLSDCRGAYLLCHYEAGEHALLLACDRLGSRPLYYAESGGILYFASTLRVLETVSALPKTMSLRAVVEQSAFGFPLASRTPYSGISVLEGAQVLDVKPGGVTCRRYRPIDPPAAFETLAEATEAAHETFLEAVALRLPPPDAPAPVAFLSGGMDSRSVVMGLMEKGVHPLTVTLGMRGRQDDSYARRFAEATNLENLFFRAGEEDWGRGILERVANLVRSPQSPARPDWPLWSGDGGSVRVGGVYVDPPLIHALQQEEVDSAARVITATRGLPKRIFRPDVRQKLDDWLLGSVTQELERLRVSDPVLWAMRFFMENDQRRHLHLLFENIDLWRFDFQLPFLDGAFQDLLASIPTEYFIGHRFYNAWAERFPADYCSVPWQSYRGHEPCPVPDPTPPRDQWSTSRGDDFRRSRWARRSATASAMAGDLPDQLLSPIRVWAAIGADSCRVRPMGYVFDTINNFAAAARPSAGRIDWPGTPLA